MKIPLVILAICTLIAGFVPFSEFVTANGDVFESEFYLSFSILPVLFALTGISIAYLLYQKQNDRAAKISNALGGFYRAAHHKFYFDEIYLFVTKKIVFNLVGKPAAWVDRNVVDGTMNELHLSPAQFPLRLKMCSPAACRVMPFIFLEG
jgi:NADH-quinone oxidoreductase subunit L